MLMGTAAGIFSRSAVLSSVDRRRLTRSDHGDDDLVARLVHGLQLPVRARDPLRRGGLGVPTVALVQQDLAGGRDQRDEQDDDQDDDGDPGAPAGALVAVLGLPGVAGGLEDDRAGDEDRRRVGQEQDEGSEREAVLAGPERDADHGQHRHQGDGDRHAGEDVGHVSPGEREGAGDAHRDGDHEVEDRRRGAAEDLRVRGDRHAVDRHQPDEHADEDVHGDAADQERQRSAQRAAVADHGRQRQPIDGRAERRDDHRADHRRRGVADDPAGGDDARQRQLHPELARLGARGADVEEDVVLKVGQRLVVLPAGVDRPLQPVHTPSVVSSSDGASIREEKRLGGEPGLPRAVVR